MCIRIQLFFGCYLLMVLGLISGVLVFLFLTLEDDERRQWGQSAVRVCFQNIEKRDQQVFLRYVASSSCSSFPVLIFSLTIFGWFLSWCLCLLWFGRWCVFGILPFFGVAVCVVWFSVWSAVSLSFFIQNCRLNVVDGWETSVLLQTWHSSSNCQIQFSTHNVHEAG